MRAFILFSGTGPILVVTTYPSVTDQRLVDRLGHKGISKFIAYEVPISEVKRAYGVPFEVIAGDLERRSDVRVLDFNGHHIFNRFSFGSLGPPITYGG